MQANYRCLKCDHKWTGEPGPTQCPKCNHLYVKWVNYEEWRKRKKHKEIMKQWDYWRKRIADGDESSAPRDWFESILDYLIEEAQDDGMDQHRR